jgi:hypothetical protein
MSTHAHLVRPSSPGRKPGPAPQESTVSTVPGRWLPLIVGCVVLAYGIILVAGYAMVAEGLAIMAAGAGIARIDYAWLCRRWIAFQIWRALAPAAREAGHRPRQARRTRRRPRALAVALAVLGIVIPAAPASAAAPDLTYGGTTSQGNPVFLELAPGGRTVKRVLGTLELKCRDGSFQTVDQWSRLRISGGRFGFPYSNPPEQFGDETMWVSGSLAGRLDPHKRTITGTWSLKSHSQNRQTGESDDCSVNTRFRLHR